MSPTSTRLLAASRVWERIKYDWRIDISAQRQLTATQVAVEQAVDVLLPYVPSVRGRDALADLIEALARQARSEEPTP